MAEEPKREVSRIFEIEELCNLCGSFFEPRDIHNFTISSSAVNRQLTQRRWANVNREGIVVGGYVTFL
jgi:hypothetical protein